MMTAERAKKLLDERLPRVEAQCAQMMRAAIKTMHEYSVSVEKRDPFWFARSGDEE